jgi:hypothetical protein
MRRFGFIALSAVLLSCAAATMQQKNFRLSSLSDPEPQDQRAVLVHVNLQSDSGNMVAIFNWGKYRAFRIYRCESPGDTFELLGTLNAGPEGSSLSLLPFYCDTRNNSLDNRYRVDPIEGSRELDGLPVIYETTDAEYYWKIERHKRRPDQSSP